MRHVLSVGEPLNPEVIRWGMNAFGLRIHDTWWMTETGDKLFVTTLVWKSVQVQWGNQFQV